ncbi:MAG: metallophosphoesterase family protein [Candidatus Bathyarchaeia archaeon]
MVRLLLISDIHANLIALRAVLKDAGAVDVILSAGDLVDYNPWPTETVDLVRQLRIRSVLGNHDRDAALGTPEGYNIYAQASCLWTHEQIKNEVGKYILSLPDKIRGVYDGVSFFICHGSPRDLLDEYVFPPPYTNRHTLQQLLIMAEADVLVMGHTHIPFIEELPEGFVVNPGSVGQPRDYDPRASYILVDIENTCPSFVFRRVSYNVGEVAKRIVEVGLPGFLAKRLYDGI